MKVLLIYPSWTGAYGIFGHFARRNSIGPPLNLMFLAAIAERQGHEAVIIDAEVERLTSQDLVGMVRNIDPDLIGLTLYTPFFHVNVELARVLRAEGNETPIAVGGPHVTIEEEGALEPEFDYGFVGQAEESWPAFLDAFGNGKDISGIEGLLYRDNGGIRKTGRPRSSRSTDGDPYPLDRLGMPARHLVKNELYRMGTLHGRFPVTPLLMSRGCPWRCIFCASEKLQTTNVALRSPGAIVDEMKAANAQYGVTHFFVVDDVMTLHRDHVEALCGLLETEGLGITFEGSTRANLVDKALIERMAECGLVRLSFGLETVDSDMRDTMKKKVPLKYYEQANRLCHEHGIEALNSVMIGLPGETRETVGKTLLWLRSSREVKQANFGIAIPYPGTEFHDIALAGDLGVQLLTRDFSNYRRYGSAVTRIGDLEPEDLIELQNEGFVSIYSAPWRWRPMLRKHGLLGGGLMLFRLIRLLIQKLLPKRRKIRPTPSYNDTEEPALAGHAGDPKHPNLL